MSSTFPEVRDLSTLTGIFRSPAFLPIAVEGQMAASGTTATLGLPETITTAEEAAEAFGDSSLTDLIAFILGRGISSVRAAASDDATPDLTDRQEVWETLCEDSDTRILLTDSAAQATLVAAAAACEDAEGIQHKVFTVGALAAASSKASLSTAAAAIGSKRGVLVGPAVYDANGDLLGGPFAAALAATEIAKNPDIADSLNLAPIAATAGIELETATGLPLFRQRINGGSPTNDFADLLDDGVSPFMTGPDGRAAFTHLRMTYTVDDTYDALMTLLIKDEVFLGVKNTLLSANYHRIANTLANRTRAAAEVDAYLKSRSNWIEPVELPNNTIGYGVTVTASVDLKAFTVSYFGQVVRGTNVINVNGTLTIPVSG